jgi:fructose-1-phosphate kinase PfkB-like protein
MSALILALNPSIDAEWRVDDVLWEEKNNIRSERRWAGGKGVNVARWLKHLGGDGWLLTPLGGRTGDELAGYLRDEQIPARIVRVREATRVNVIVTTRAGRQLRFNPPGPKLSRAEWSRIVKSVERWLGGARRSVRADQRTSDSGAHGVAHPTGLLVLSGSLPRGVPVTAYAQLVRLAHGYGVRTLLDCDGPAFAAAVKARPFLVKPNEHELARWWRKPMRAEAEVVRAARALSAQTRGWVLVSRGPKRGLLINVAGGFEALARPPRVTPRNTVGAGDALLAAVAWQVQRGATPSDWLDAGLRVGSAATVCAAGRVTVGSGGQG